MSDSSRPHRLQATRLLCPWGFPGKDTGVGSHVLLQGIFPTQGSNPCLLHCRQTFYHLEPPGMPYLTIFIGGLAGASDAGHHTGSNPAVVLSSVLGPPGYQKENGPSSTDYRRKTQKQGKPSSINNGSFVDPELELTGSLCAPQSRPSHPQREPLCQHLSLCPHLSLCLHLSLCPCSSL